MLHLYQSHDLCELSKLFIQSTNEMRDPFKSELVITQTKGMERWLMLQYAKQEDIVAGFEFQTPVQFLMKLHFLLVGEHEKRNVFERDVMPWSLYEIIVSKESEPALKMLRLYLGESPSTMKIFGLCKKISNLFDQYMIYRPEMLEGWLEGKETFQNSRYAKYEEWQAYLWRALYAYRDFHFEKEQQGLNLVELFNSLNSTIERMSSEEIAYILPRLSLFGMSLLPPRYIETFHLLSEKIRVNLFLLNPSREYWFDIYSDRAISKMSEALEARGKNAELFHLTGGNRLLANMGRTGADFFQLIFDREPEVCDTEKGILEDEETLLAMVKGDILFCRDELEPRIVKPHDRSIEIISCHSQIREVETLLDALLENFEHDTSLLPSDILVVSPNMDSYAPFVEQVFAASYETSGVRLPYAIADLSFRNANRTAEFVLDLLEVVQQRFGASTVIALYDDFCAMSGTNMQDDDRSLLKKWVSESGIRWGIDANHRSEENLPPYRECSWDAGIERLLLGYAMDDALFDEVLPYSEIEGNQAVLLGNFLHFFTILKALYGYNHSEMSVAHWRDLLMENLEKLWDQKREVEGLNEVYKILSRIAEPSDTARVDKYVSLSFFRMLLVDLFDSNESGGNFLNGSITFASMIPMRSIPFKIIVMMGMNIENFPRRNERSEFDLMRVPGYGKRGDRNQRNSDLYLFLEILTSVETKLLITYCGRDAKDNAPLPASLTVEYLKEYIQKNFSIAEGSLSIYKEQVLQPFSHTYLDEEGLRTFNVSWFTPSSPKHEQNPFTWKLQGGTTPVAIDGNAMMKFFHSPVDYFFKQCCAIESLELTEEIKDSEAFTLDALERYQVNSAIIESRLSGIENDIVERQFQAQGDLPIHELGHLTMLKQNQESSSFLKKIYALSDSISPFEIALYETIQGVMVEFGKKVLRFDNHCILAIPAKIKGKYRMEQWITHLFLNLKEDIDTSLITRDEEVTLRSLPSKEALQYLGILFGLFCSGTQHQALPFFPDASFEYYYRTEIKKGRKEPLLAAWDLIKPNSSSYQKSSRYWELFPKGVDSLEALGIKDSFVALASCVYEPLCKHWNM